MRQRGRKSRLKYLVPAGMLLLGGALAVPAGAVASTPSQDQYTFNLPTSSGQKPTGGQEPVSKPQDLSPSQQAAASGPDSTQLTQIATSPDLGAPPATQTSTTEDSSSGSNGSESGHSGSGQSQSGPVSPGGGSGHSGEGRGSGLDLGGSEPAAPAAVTNTVGAGPVIALLAVIGLTAGIGLLAALRRRRLARGGGR